MTRASQARRVASAAAYGSGGLVGIGATVAGVLFAEAKLARRAIGGADGEPLDPSGTYRSDRVPPGAELVRLVLLGDSSAAGFGVDSPDETPAAVIARGLSERLERPVHASSVARVGAQSSELATQLDLVLGEEPPPHIAVVMIGANDVTNRVRPSDAVRALGEAVARLRDADVEVVVGTCPDLGTVRPIRHPLRLLARRQSRSLAAAQTIAVVEAGGRSVSLGDLLGPEFESRASEMFGPDGFHPSPAGYAAAAQALLPSVCAALGDSPADADDVPWRPDDVMPVAEAAVEAVDAAGTEVTGTRVDGLLRGPRGLWAGLRRLPGIGNATSVVHVTPDGEVDSEDQSEESTASTDAQ